MIGRQKRPKMLSDRAANMVNSENITALNKVSLGEATQIYAKIGLLSFGGPAGQIALMHRLLVEEKRWLEEKQFLHALNFCMLLPGPEAMQLATYCGWLLHGVKGGLIAGILFVLPGVLVLLGLSMLYVSFGEVPIVAGLLFGLKAAVLAIVVQALVKVSKKALKGGPSYYVAIAGFVALAFLKLPFPLVIFCAGLIGFFLPTFFSEKEQIAIPKKVQDPWRYVSKVLGYGVLFWVIPVFLIGIIFGGSNVVFFKEAFFFSKASLVTFGGAYAVLAYVGQQAVEVFGWLKPDEMLTGLGLAETTPGPLVLVLVFVGFVGAFRDAVIFDPIVSGLLGGFITAWVTFVPCFIWIFLGAPFVEALRGNRKLSGALAAITAAVVGVIANLSLWFAIHVLFHKVDVASFGPFNMEIPVLASLDWRAALIAIGAGLFIWRGIGLFWLLGAATLAGAGLRVFSS